MQNLREATQRSQLISCQLSATTCEERLITSRTGHRTQKYGISPLYYVAHD